MTPKLQIILDQVQQAEKLSAEEKETLKKAILDADKSQAMVQFKLDRIEKDRNTLSIMLEETIDDLQKKNKAVETQNRELEIESSLERVRTAALAMKEPADMPEVCKIIAQQLDKLGVKEIRNVQTAIFYESKRVYMNYEYYAKHDKTVITETSYTNHKIHEAFANQMLKGKGEVYSTHIPAGELKNWVAYQKTTNVFIDSFLETASSLNYYWHSLGPVALGISTYIPLKEEELSLFKRFLNVFELAYTRYLDIEQAIAQAREARIEAALEKVRGRAMAMHKSDELLEAAALLYHELFKLGIPTLTSGYVLMDAEEKIGWNYVINPADGTILPKPAGIPHTETEVMRSITNSWKKQEPFHVRELGPQATIEHHRYLAENSIDFPISVEKFLAVTPERLVFYTFNFKQGYLLITGGNLLTADQVEMVVRFAKVFEMTYRRFLDLKQSESQTRESQIELGLERVRARAMAMQKSDELSDLVDTVFKELTKLDFALNWCIINIIDEPNLTNMVWAANPETNKPPESYLMKFEDYPFHHSMMKGYQERKTKHVYVIEGKEKTTYDDYLFNKTEWRRVPKAAQAASRAMKRYVATFTFSNFGGLQTVGEEYLSEENLDILSRFGKVFDLTYTRFNDLQKAEAQAREAQIEAALERVRSRSMGMQKSEELKEVIKIVYQQLRHLNIKLDHAGFVVDYTPGGDWHFWIADERDIPSKITHPWFESVWANQFDEAKETGTDFFATHLNFEEKNKFYQALLSYVPGLPQASKDFYLNCPGLAASTVLLENVGLYIENFSGTPYTDEDNVTLMRFGKVFQQTYTRFLDLQKAEAQAREAQIELGLERVRARAMTMQNSNELAELVSTVFKELTQLDFILAGCIIWIHDHAQSSNTLWMASAEMNKPAEPFQIQPFYAPFFKSIIHAWKEKDAKWIYTFTGSEKKIFENAFFKELPHLPDALRKALEIPEQVVFSASYYDFGALQIVETEALTHEKFAILHRFGKAFNSSYTRFNDLQKAEAQAREAKIEAALEKVRSSTMAMHHSDHLSETAFVLFKQFKELGEVPERIFIATFNEEDYNLIDLWGTNEGGNKLDKLFKVPVSEPTVIRKINTAWKEKKKSVIIDLSGNELNEYLHFLKSSGMPFTEGVMTNRRVQTVACFSKGVIGVTTPEPQSIESVTLLEKFAGVFDLAYIRFLDLKQAEAQAREATIEISLERVRSKTMAMHNSQDVGETVATLFDEFEKLGVHTNRCGILINSKETMEAEVWTARSNPSGKANLIIGQLDLTMHPLLQGIYHAWKSKETVFYYTMMGDDLKSYYQAINNTKYYPTQFDLDALPSKEFHTDFYFAEGSIFAFTAEAIKEEEASIFKRFANVFGQTYRRYLDLQKAEAQARQAKIEAAMEKVRSRAMAMQKPHELVEVAELLRKEMGLLGVEELETSSIYIHDEETGKTECWYAIKDNQHPDKELVSDYMNIDLNETTVGKQMLAFYNSGKKQISIPMQGDARKEWINYCADHSAVLAGFYGDAIPDRTYHLYKFSNGYMGAASPGEISAESRDLLQRATSVFSLAYTRFNDLQIAEAHALQAEKDLLAIKEAKQKAEEALTELQATQKQLFQSEKMASLGELTAGIAHEIQNPLNFVNNFSEVSNELIDEMMQEVVKGNYTEVKAIADDVKQNLEKINHHGKRADSIVKGMLQHSRNSSGQKEPTDINILADECMRLSYHGLRAKDKSFNAKTETDFDSSMPKINIAPQDIGRVIINLFTNAFYSVMQKEKTAPPPPEGGIPYEPTVRVSTHNSGKSIMIKIRDNGNGVPQKVMDKIFQPFFTTKPVGEGTGLGLSMSYEIITKGHGGELKVESQEGDFAEFSILLPV